MRKSVRFVSCVFGLVIPMFLFCVGGALADKVVLVNGDTLTGTVVKAEGGKLTLKTEYSGPIEIDITQIKTITSDNPVEVRLATGEVLKGKLQSLPDGKMVVEKSEERDRAVIDWTKVSAINPPPVVPPQWHGNVTAGGSIQTGNTDRRTAAFAAEAMRKTDDDRLTFRYLFNYADEDGDVTSRSHYGMGKYDYFFTKKWYGYLTTELESDTFKDLTLRVTASPGVGYQVWDDKIKALGLEAGLAYVNENWDDGKDKDYIAARGGFNFRYNLWNFATFTDQFVIYPSLESSKYTLRNEAAVTKPLSTRWSLKLANIVDYDSKPPDGIKKTDVYWIGGLQFNF
jgi:putative salt-induced outer membrane protein YdiY